MRLTPLLAVAALLGLAAAAPAFAQNVNTGLEVSVSSVAPRGGVLLYPGGEYSRSMPTLLYPGQRSGPIVLHMPTRRTVARAVPRPQTASQAQAQVAPAPKPEPKPEP